jgi:hypothetical protein
MFFRNCKAAMLWQNARIVSNAVWNARPATGILEMILERKGWTEGG